MPAALKHLEELLADKSLARKMSLFAKWPSDRLFYPVSLIKLDHTSRMASVRFEDGVNFECSLADMHLQFLGNDAYEDSESDIVCSVCDSGQESKQNELVICDVCQQGYHQKCHAPKIPTSILQPALSNDEWICTTCDYVMNQLKTSIKSGAFASTPKIDIKKQKKDPATKANKETKALSPKPPAHTELPPEPKTKVKGASQERQMVARDNPVATPDSSTDRTLALTIEKLSTQAGAESENAPVDVKVLALDLFQKGGSTKTPDLIDAITDQDMAEPTKKALENLGESVMMAIEGPKDTTAEPSRANTKVKVVKPVAKKAAAKKIPQRATSRKAAPA